MQSNVFSIRSYIIEDSSGEHPKYEIGYKNISYCHFRNVTLTLSHKTGYFDFDSRLSYL